MRDKTTTVDICEHEEESYGEVINNICHYKAPFMARCSYNYFPPKRIWDGGKIYKTWRK